MNIFVNITNKHAQVVGAPVIVCGNSDHVLEFSFDAEWGPLPVKTARFVWVTAGKVKYQDVVFSGSTVAVPILSNTRQVRVGVFAGDLKTTTPAIIPCEPSILCGTGMVEEKPTENQYNQIMALLNDESNAAKQDVLSWVTSDDVAAMLANNYEPAVGVPRAINDAKLYELVQGLTAKTALATISTNWSGTGPYTQTVPVAGILATDRPHVTPVYDDDLGTAGAQKAAWGLILDGEAQAGGIVFRAQGMPTVAIPIQVEVNR